MRKITGSLFQSLDGVIQAPGGPEEDQTGFRHGGWTFPYFDDSLDGPMNRLLGGDYELLLGRRTYEIFAAYWPHADTTDNPIAQKLNALPKYVASTTLDSLEWENSQLIGGDVADAVGKLKEQPGDELQVHGSGALATYLIDHGLVDEYRLLTFPVYLGTGKKLFADGVRPGALRLLSSSTTSTGVVVSNYAAAGAPSYGTYGLDQQ